MAAAIRPSESWPASLSIPASIQGRNETKTTTIGAPESINSPAKTIDAQALPPVCIGLRSSSYKDTDEDTIAEKAIPKIAFFVTRWPSSTRALRRLRISASYRCGGADPVKGQLPNALTQT